MTKNNSPNSFVTTLTPAQGNKLLLDLESQDYEISKPPYTLFAAKKKGISCTYYTSGKLVVQGKEKDEFIKYYLEPEVMKEFSYSYGHLEHDVSPRIGIDESGKGDFFGPLCVAGVFAGGDDIAKLKDMGVRDSKAMTEVALLKVAREIRNNFQYHIVKVTPKKYNELYTKFKNLNRLLAWCHATTIETLVEKSGCRKVIIDQFASEDVVITALSRKQMDVDLTQRHRGEEDLVVAAASILAREAFVMGLKKLGEEYGMELPKGASAKTIAAGKKFAANYGREALDCVGKLHFKTLDAIVN